MKSWSDNQEHISIKILREIQARFSLSESEQNAFTCEFESLVKNLDPADSSQEMVHRIIQSAELLNDQEIPCIKLSLAEIASQIFLAAKTIEDKSAEIEKYKKEIMDLGRKDGLTGLYNFEFFQEELNRRINEYQRVKGVQFLSLAMIKVDQAKEIIDQYGFLSSNQILCSVATRLNSVARQMDVVCRLGGDTFTAILPKCSIEGALGFSERLRKNICNSPFFINNGKPEISVSIGCTEYAPNEESSEFTTRAETALKNALKKGGNTVAHLIIEEPE